ncbi:DUF1127 domain-containing protein [Xinfangfangia sp. CPCC 101601]|uniref:DUF1127 domain-containing protein n=2 Tax=Pseudogemmobacter lacusdianii TaxID=3069608 RepID=A0ABU0VTF6_9RHOB|nr:DUF1127 domain-containing protein [Xinfangfangia sp. CPCC 101601]
MAYVNSAAYAQPSRLAGLYASLMGALARRRLYNETLAELRQLSDRDLADLGISRFSITELAHEATYGK